MNLIADDTNVMIRVPNSDQIRLPIFQKRGNQPPMRYIINTSSISNATIESVSTALPRFLLSVIQPVLSLAKVYLYFQH